MKSIPTQLGVAGFKGISHGRFSIGLRYDQKTHHSEAITVVLSEKGWIRHAKGHDVDCQSLNYKAGDNYLTHACGK
ncbi:hypothetical protein, partial [Vibrio cholerae]|uniref:hypothetical protein n=1 Tax=Vibrio cholerae TaxID=666 RepID=UPI003080E6B4